MRYVKGMVVSLLLCATMTWAGSLDAPSGPTDGGSAMYTLEDIYNRLNDGTSGSKRPGAFTEPSSGPTTGNGTGFTLDEIMQKAPAVDVLAASPADVVQGKTFWGLKITEWGVQTGEMPPPGVPKTGAGPISGYTLEDKEDGSLQSGLPWPDPRFTDNLNGTVTDNLTGLIWLKKVQCANAATPWSTALSDVAQLNTDGTMNGNSCGDTSNGGTHQTDWTLPNVRQLLSLIDYGRNYPVLPEGHPFDWTSNTVGFWSSTTAAYNPPYAFIVHLHGVHVNQALKTFQYYAFPVRSVQ